MSGLTLPVFAFSAPVVQNLGGLIAIFSQISHKAVWALATYLTLNSLINLLSKSQYQHFIARRLSIASAF